MNILSLVMAVFAMIGAADRIFGGKLGLGRHFEKGFHLFGTMALSMIGMIVLSPAIAQLLNPVVVWIGEKLPIDPSVIPAVVFANDMGGASLSKELCITESVGMFNAMVVSSMMGCTISFTIPVALEMAPEEKQKDVLFGFLCGIVTIPVGCFVAGLFCEIPLGMLLWNLLPLVIFAGAIACGLVFAPKGCVKVFQVFGKGMKILITIGLALGIWQYLTGMKTIPGLETLEEGAMVCVNAAVVMSGAFPLIHLISLGLKKPLTLLGKKMGINAASAMGFLSSLATSVTTFESIKDMDAKGTVLNAAFAISAAFTFAGHLAFTMAFAPDYIFPVILGKLISGVTALLLAVVMYRRRAKTA